MQSLHVDPKFQLRYLVMPDYIYTDNRLTLIAVKIYCFINTYKNPFFFTNEHLAEMFDCSERNIEKGIALLKELNYIEAKHKNKAGGGKTRLIQTTLEGGLEPHSSSVGEEKVEVANHTTVGRKEVKENNKKDFSEILPIRQEDRISKIGNRKTLEFPPYKKSETVKSNGYKPRRGVDATHIR